MISVSAIVTMGIALGSASYNQLRHKATTRCRNVIAFPQNYRQGSGDSALTTTSHLVDEHSRSREPAGRRSTFGKVMPGNQKIRTSRLSRILWKRFDRAAASRIVRLQRVFVETYAEDAWDGTALRLLRAECWGNPCCTLIVRFLIRLLFYIEVSRGVPFPGPNYPGPSSVISSLQIQRRHLRLRWLILHFLARGG